ncbi:peroxisomal membrane protein 2 [Drosophila sulfurigaster albostrigata]|uniref:Peroxisomal membrane protein 2 n=1 Tax=Drosophila albomicans TaxID=7291 RepID=A0A6P8X8P6_DROAB|nr:peroxisomal membrane protein 2 [Drosophila albomicans]XP_034108363.1 peroxisomal membrane protein 2 [Drosophila albomicans]XP_034108365.1 peroxisomal membrane protein 2 [Drosophila albomicans]XP_060653736.1 peroxisomal membrane protein 2 [Drosophila nasuta]XP_060653737.1 peroxisomal membrane protein 2 [Drosophila nasuta]XP_060653738.1 peroxisomal membrane protein 2 [Drosophila nasuta]XP_062137197.1 peroxisomal membrane protein 2 [Drosophila sulfurigaster albostrigata]XP_062137198.1 peroxi
MSLSRPLYSLFGSYLEQLFNHPVRTKCLTACFLATSANVTSQRISGAKTLNQHSVFAYGVFGLIFGGTVPHYFYQIVERLFSHDLRFRKFFIFLSERFAFAPLYQFLSLYFLSIFEGNSHAKALQNVEKLYWPVLRANWQYISLLVYLNIAYVPPMFRSISSGIIAFIWAVYLAQKRRRHQEKLTAEKSK